jgi:hypothetical protein
MHGKGLYYVAFHIHCIHSLSSGTLSEFRQCSLSLEAAARPKLSLLSTAVAASCKETCKSLHSNFNSYNRIIVPAAGILILVLPENLLFLLFLSFFLEYMARVES